MKGLTLLPKLIIAALATTIISAPSFSLPLQNATKLPPNFQVGTLTKTSVKQDGQGSFTAAATTSLNQNSALSSFYLGFLNGDHKIRGFRIMPENDTAHMMLIDSDSNDQYHANANWWNIPGAIGGFVEFPQDSHISNPIPAGPANSTLVISGFEAYISAWDDCDIWNFGVKFNQSNDRMIIEMGSNCNKVKRRRGAYVWVPNSYIAANKIVTGSQRGREQVSGVLPPTDKYVIRGFHFEFQNGSHHLLNMGVTMEPPIASVVHWMDNNMDDPIQWRVDYSVLK